MTVPNDGTVCVLTIDISIVCVLTIDVFIDEITQFVMIIIFVDTIFLSLRRLTVL